jgi:hypothetical protein
VRNLPPEEQRHFRRYALRFPCAVSLARKRKRAPDLPTRVETKNVSKGGLYFISSEEWKVGTLIECVIELPLQIFGARNVAIRSRGKIVRLDAETEGGTGVGATIESFQFVQPKRSAG